MRLSAAQCSVVRLAACSAAQTPQSPGHAHPDPRLKTQRLAWRMMRAALSINSCITVLIRLRLAMPVDTAHRQAVDPAPRAGLTADAL
jgi:hypothetical protein